MSTVNPMNPTVTNARSFYARLSTLGFALFALTGLFALVWRLAVALSFVLLGPIVPFSALHLGQPESGGISFRLSLRSQARSWA